MKKFTRVTRNESKEARLEFSEIIKILRNELRNEYKFCVFINGSARYNCIVRDSNNEFDIDYRIILTRNSKSKNYPNDPTQIRRDFFDKLQQVVSKLYSNSYKCENSKSVITLIKIINNKRLWSYDICIVKELSQFDDVNYEYIARNSQSNNKDGGNVYTWNMLGKYNKANYVFKNMNYLDKTKLIEEYILPEKQLNKKFNENDKFWRTSEQIFIEAVYKYNEKI